MQACVARVRSLGDYRVEEFRLVEERVMFPLPGELLAAARSRGVSVGAGQRGALPGDAAAEFRITHH